MRDKIAILGAAALIAISILFTFRWELSAYGGTAYRLDRWTGEIVACHTNTSMHLALAPLGVGLKARCTEMTQEEIRKSAGSEYEFVPEPMNKLP